MSIKIIYPNTSSEPYGDYLYWNGKTFEPVVESADHVLMYLDRLDENYKKNPNITREREIYELARENGIFPVIEDVPWDPTEIRPLHEILGFREGIYDKYIRDVENGEYSAVLSDLNMIVYYSLVRIFLEECRRMRVRKFYEFGYGDRTAVEIVGAPCLGDYNTYFPFFLNAVFAHHYPHLHHLILCCAYYFDYMQDRSLSSVPVNIVTNPVQASTVDLSHMPYDVLDIFCTIMEPPCEGFGNVDCDGLSGEILISIAYETDTITHISDIIKYGKNKKYVCEILSVAWDCLPHDYDEDEEIPDAGIERKKKRKNPFRSVLKYPTDIYLLSSEYEEKSAHPYMGYALHSSTMNISFISIYTLINILTIPREKHEERICSLEMDLFKRIINEEGLDDQQLHKYILTMFPDYYEAYYGEKPLFRVESRNEDIDHRLIFNGDNITLLINLYPYPLFYEMVTLSNYVKRTGDRDFDIIKEEDRGKRIGITRKLIWDAIRIFIAGSSLDNLMRYIEMSDELKDAANTLLPIFMERYYVYGRGMRRGLIPNFMKNRRGLYPSSRCIAAYDRLSEYVKSVMMEGRTDAENYHLYFTDGGYEYTMSLINLSNPTDVIHVCFFGISHVIGKRMVIPNYSYMSDHRTSRIISEISPLIRMIATDRERRKKDVSDYNRIIKIAKDSHLLEKPEPVSPDGSDNPDSEDELIKLSRMSRHLSDEIISIIPKAK